MRYALVSDIHSNIQAWNAVYQDILNIGVDEIVCLGDIVGYGPDPLRVFDACYANIHHIVLGNHDAAVAGQMILDRFNRGSREIIEWTRNELDDSAIEFLGQLPLVLNLGDAVLTHATVNNPAGFDYIYDPQDCQSTWSSCYEQIVFIGHTHIPAIHMVGEMGIPQSMPAQDIRISREIRYVINVGSVGQPRDGDMRACYVIYDSERQTIEFRRIQYELNEYLRTLMAVDLPVHPSMLEGAMQQPSFSQYGVAGGMPKLLNVDAHGEDEPEPELEPEVKPALEDTQKQQRRRKKGRKTTISQGGGQIKVNSRTGKHVAAVAERRGPVAQKANPRRSRPQSNSTAQIRHQGTQQLMIPSKSNSASTLLMILIALLCAAGLGAALIMLNNSKQHASNAVLPVKQDNAYAQGHTPAIAPNTPRGTSVRNAPRVARQRTVIPVDVVESAAAPDDAEGYVGVTGLLYGDADLDDNEAAEW